MDVFDALKTSQWCSTFCGATFLSYNKSSKLFTINSKNFLKPILLVIYLIWNAKLFYSAAKTSAVKGLIGFLNATQIYVWLTLLIIEVIEQILCQQRSLKVFNNFLRLERKVARNYNREIFYCRIKLIFDITFAVLEC